MKIKWFNVASFLLTSDAGTRIITDPFFHLYQPPSPPPGWNSNRPGIDEYADVIAMTHGHFDHSYVCAVKGVPRLYTGGAPVAIQGVSFSSIVSWHDNYGQGGRGTNSLLCMEMDGLRICHMGDYGQKRLTVEQKAKMGRVDILLTPWGDFGQALLDDLSPKIAIPMHHTTVDQLKHLKGFSDMSEKTSELEVSAGALPPEMKVIMLKTSLESSM